MQKFPPYFLDSYVPFSDLPSGDRLRLVQKIEIIDLSAGTRLYAHDVSAWLVYLLQGKVDVCQQYLNPELLSHQYDNARQPLFRQHEEEETHVVALNDCKLFRIERRFFNSLLDQEVLIAESSSSVSMDQINATIYNQILQAVESDRLKLPSLPEVALQVKQAIGRDTIGVNEISRIIESDPAMVMRLIQVANSPISRGVEPISSIRDAIVRLGLAMTQTLVTSLAMKQLFKTRHKVLHKCMQQLYAHSVEVAAISYALAKRTAQFDADQLLLAGLIHDIGVIPIIAYIDETGLDIQSASEVENIVTTLRATVGSMVVKNWDFPNAMINLVEQAENWMRNSGEKLDMTDIVIAAQIYSMLQHGEAKKLPDLRNVPVFKKLFPEKQDPEFAMQVLAEAREEINEVQRLLQL